MMVRYLHVNAVLELVVEHFLKKHKIKTSVWYGFKCETCDELWTSLSYNSENNRIDFLNKLKNDSAFLSKFKMEHLLK